MAINSFKRAGLPTTNTNFIPAANFTNTATGTYTDGSGFAWKYVSFTASGNLVISSSGYADILIVAGGGGGGGHSGQFNAPSGGAGGVVNLTGSRAIFISSGTYSVVIGGGGAGGVAGVQTNGSRGGDSSIATIATATGGGPGGKGEFSGGLTAADCWGGSAGVPWWAGNSNFNSSLAIPMTNQGNYASLNENAGPGAGGGAGGAGSGGTGGAGIILNITNTNVEYGKGGNRRSTSAVRGSGPGAGGIGNESSVISGTDGIVVVRVRTN